MPKSNKTTTGAPVGSGSCRVPEAGRSQKRMLRAQSAEGWCSQTGTLQAHIPNEASDGLALSTFDPSLEYSTDKMVLFWQTPPYVSQWCPTSFVADDVSYSCAVQYMVAENARTFKEHHAVELIMSSPDLSTHKCVGRGVRNFGSAGWDREKQSAVLSGTYAEFTQSPAMKPHLLSTDNKRLAEATSLNPVWGIGLRADDLRAKNPHKGRGKTMFGEACCSQSNSRQRVRVSKLGLPSSVPKPHWECWNPRNLIRSAVALGNHGRSFRSSSFGEFSLGFGRTRRPKSRGFGDSFWRRLRPCTSRTRPLPRRGYHDAGRRFFHCRGCNT